MAKVTLLGVSVYDGKAQVDFVVKDKGGRVRVIEYTWMTRYPAHVPDTWVSAVEGEVDFQLSEETSPSAAFRRLL